MLVAMPWLNAGLAGEWLSSLFAIIVIVLLAKTIYFNRKEIKRIWYIFLPLYFFFLLLFISSFNVTFQKLDELKWKSLDLDNAIVKETDPEKIKMINNHFRNIYLMEKQDPKLAIAIFFNLKNTYLKTFGNKPTPALSTISKYENLITLGTSHFIPSSIIASHSIIPDYLYIICSILFFYLCYLSFHNKKSIRKLLMTFFISSGILALVGIYQKYNYTPNNNTPEIFGIWDTPEPRYFFASFTYKNHWSCFAVISLSVGFAFLIRNIHIHTDNFLRSKIIPFISLFCFILFISTVYSASRSGVIISLLFVSILFPYIKIFKSKVLFVILSLSFSIFFFSFKDNKSITEMHNNTKQQIVQFKLGGLPLRLHLWHDLYQQISLRTFWGYGINSYRSINPIHQSNEVLNIRSIGLQYAHNLYTPLIGHGHNDWLELFSEIGWIGFSFVLLPALLLIIREMISTESLFAKSLFLGCFSYCLFSLIDFPIRTPACFIIFCGIFGVALKYSKLSSN
ncbi:MAG: hypothetical protein CBC00_04555 [Verrucomicrobia bacterium TMED40]|nr:MAG: hypothetical protein CBC00_04555 [Verrucomicrobia bacterium TMED40]